MRKQIFSIVMAAVTAVVLGVTALADPITDTYSCKTYVSAKRQYAREFAVETEYKKGTVDIITAGIKCLRIDTGAAVGPGDLVSNKNNYKAVAYESILYADCSKKVRAFGSHSAYKNGQAVVFEFTQSIDAV